MVFDATTSSGNVKFRVLLENFTDWSRFMLMQRKLSQQKRAFDMTKKKFILQEENHNQASRMKLSPSASHQPLQPSKD